MHFRTFVPTQNCTHSLTIPHAFTHTHASICTSKIFALYCYLHYACKTLRELFSLSYFTFSASSVWQPDLAQSHMQVLQRTQNSALRIATGYTRTTPTAHLHAETKVLPLKDYLELRGTQIFSAAAAPDHPLHEGLYNPVGTRSHIHTTPSSLHGGACHDHPSHVRKVRELLAASELCSHSLS